MTEKQYLDNLRDSLFEMQNKKGWTNTELAIQCDMSSRSMCHILYREKEDIRFSIVVKISERLNIPLAVLIGADEELEIGQYKKIVTSVFRELKPYVAERTVRA